MIISVSILIIFSGAATPSSLSNFCIVLVPAGLVVAPSLESAGLAQTAGLRKPSGLLLELGNPVEGADPAARRAPPDLPFRHQLVALLQHSDAHDVDGLWPFAGCGRIERGAAGRAERLQPRIAALGARLDVGRRLPAADLQARS